MGNFLKGDKVEFKNVLKITEDPIDGETFGPDVFKDFDNMQVPLLWNFDPKSLIGSAKIEKENDEIVVNGTIFNNGEISKKLIELLNETDLIFELHLSFTDVLKNSDNVITSANIDSAAITPSPANKKGF